MRVRIAAQSDLEDWAALRAALWPDRTTEEHRQDIAALLRRTDGRELALVAVEEPIGIKGFAEASLRQDYVNGCETLPVVFLEGIYVRPDCRDSGVGQALCSAVEAWGRAQRCGEFASDAHLDNRDSHAFHRAVGFKETERVVYFRKLI